VGTYRLDRLFNPNSVAIIGASDRADSVGGVVLRKLIEGNFKGLITPINPKYATVNGLKCFTTLTETGHIHDLIIIVTPAEVVPNLITEAAALGCKVAIILTAGLGRGKGSLSDTLLKTAKAAGLRLVGPNCLGVLSPYANLNASFATQLPPKGSLALISQSGAIAAGMAAWAKRNDIGFSNVVSLGEAIDIDIADCLDYCTEDKATRAILLYVESIQDTRKFMSAARRAARVKPVVVLKAGRHAEGAKAAATHTGALAGSDAVYDAAFQRAGCSRVMDLRELFQAAEVFSSQDVFTGEKITILTNGGGLGVLAVDRVMDLGGSLAQLSLTTIDALDAVLPETWSRSNPIDIIGDATADRYAKALSCILDDEGCDIILVMNCPTAINSSHAAAEAIVNTVKASSNKKSRRAPLFACWLSMQAEQQKQFRDAQIIPFETEAEAVEGIMLLVKDHRQRQYLRQEIPASQKAIIPDRLTTETVIRAAVAERRSWLSPIEVSQLLTAYGITAPPVVEAATPEIASELSKQFLANGGACVVKLLSRDITHQSDVDGVRLNLASTNAVRSATLDIIERARKLRPDARIDGVTVQPMIVRPKARELIAGIAVDPTFGPIILFGHGGTAVELINDKALSLLPLNMTQAHELIERTHISRVLKGYRNVPAADTTAVAETLVRLSRMVEDRPEIVGIDLNPLLADESGVLALDARIEINPAMAGQTTKALRTRFSIRPYPRELEHNIHLQSGLELFIRPLRPDDEGMLTEMMKHVTADDVRMRFFIPRKTMDRTMIARLTQLDYARDMALVALDKTNLIILGVARLMGDANQQAGEYAILVRSDHQFEGIGTKLMQDLLSFAASEGYSRIYGHIMSENQKMLNLCKMLGFTLKQSAEAGIILSELNLLKQQD
jgi:acetyltransferase